MLCSKCGKQKANDRSLFCSRCCSLPLKILYVDKDQGMRALFIRLLDFLGFESQAESSTGEALKKLREEHFDLVIAEFEMPEMDGRELARRIKIIRPMCPVLLLAGPDMSLDAEAEKSNGIDAIVVRPTTVEVLHAEILKIFSIRNLE